MPNTSKKPAQPKTPKAEERRYDPRHRNPKGTNHHGTEVVNGNPNLRYQLVDATDTLCGKPHYEALGYEVERSRRGGPRLKVGETSRQGEPITFMGQVLMSIHKQTHADLVKYGAYGTGGQEAQDNLEKRIVKNRKGAGDMLRGIRSDYMYAQNDIEPTYEEFAQ